MNEFEKNINKKLNELSKAVNKVLNRAGIKMVATTRKLMDQGGNYASRRLNDLTNYKIENSVLTFGSNASNKGYNYGLAYEFGRKPGTFPNIKDLEKWVLRKSRLGLLRINPDFGRTQEARVKTVTYLIGRAIKKNGIKGKFHYQVGFLAGNKLFNDEINNAIIKAFS